jgi:hypothetical protein
MRIRPLLHLPFLPAAQSNVGFVGSREHAITHSYNPTYHYASEARGYSSMRGFCALALLSWQNVAALKNRVGWLFLLFGVLVMAVSSHYYAISELCIVVATNYRTPFPAAQKTAFPDCAPLSYRVYFRREVLTKYFGEPDRYCVSDGRPVAALRAIRLYYCADLIPR